MSDDRTDPDAAALDEAVLAFLRAQEENPQLDRSAWLEQHADWGDVLRAFFADQERFASRASALTSQLDTSRPETTGVWTAATQISPGPGQFVAGTRVGDHELLSVLGRGGMGVVYKARHTKLRRFVALKMILAGSHAEPGELSRFYGEAESIARVKHPNIIEIYEIGTSEQHPFISLEYAEGGSLAEKLAGTTLEPEAAARLVEALARGMHTAHEHKIIHRDLKPANVLLTADGVPKITDFGLAKRLDDDSAQTQAGAVVGTPSYMAPEQAEGKPADPASDIYALGALLYETLTGRPPFKGANVRETLYQACTEEPVAPRRLQPKTPRDLETICLKCLHKKPAGRYASANLLAEDLARFLQGRPILARPVSMLEHGWRWCRRNPLKASLAATSLTAVLVLLGVFFFFNRQLRRQLEENEQARRDLQVTLTRQMAERLDGDLRQLAGVPQAMAATLAQRADWTDQQLEMWIRTFLQSDARLFGVCVAFDPSTPQGKKAFPLYVYRADQKIVAMRLTPEAYDPVFHARPWYVRPREEKEASWSEPFIDVGGGDIPMITYSVPLFREGEFVGVVSADLSLAYFDVLRNWLDELKLGSNGYGFVLSPEGTFISHPREDYRLPHKIGEHPDFQNNDDLRRLTARWLKGESGIGKATDPTTGRPALFSFAPVRSSGWSLVTVVED